MFFLIYNFLSGKAKLPDEIIYKILFYYGGYTHPFVKDLLKSTINESLENKYIRDYKYFKEMVQFKYINRDLYQLYYLNYYEKLKKYVIPIKKCKFIVLRDFGTIDYFDKKNDPKIILNRPNKILERYRCINCGKNINIKMLRNIFYFLDSTNDYLNKSDTYLQIYFEKERNKVNMATWWCSNCSIY